MGGHVEAAGSGQGPSSLSRHLGSFYVYPAWKGNRAGVGINLQMGSQGSPAFQILPTASVPPAGRDLNRSSFPLCPSMLPAKGTSQHKRAPWKVGAPREVGPSMACDKPDVDMALILTNAHDIQFPLC